jgi:hypothetical protein
MVTNTAEGGVKDLVQLRLPSARTRSRGWQLIGLRTSIAQSTTVQYIQQKNWTNLRKHVGYHSKKAAVRAATVTEVETRDRHSLVSLAAPNDVDEEDPCHLRDEQVSQIFFNCLVTELFVAATFNDSATETSPVCVPNATHPRFYNGSHNLTVHHALRQLAKVVGSGEAVAVDMTGMICSGGGNIMVLAMIVTGMTEACLLIATALLCRIIFRFGNKPVSKPIRHVHSWRLVLAWLLNFMFFAGGLWYMSAVALCYGREQTDKMLMGWVTSTCISWFVMEPGFIILIVALPCLCQNSLVDWCNTRMNDIGCDLSMIVG